MPFSGGNYSLPAGNPVVSGTTISSTVQNNTMTDVATALSTTLCKDGQSTPSANLPMAGFKFTGLGPGSATGDSLRWQQLFSQGVEADIASATSCDIGGQNTSFLRVTGTTTIASFGANYNGPRFLRFAGAVILTYNASTLILPGGASITTAAGDTCIAIPISGGWYVAEYQRADGTLFSNASFGASLATAGYQKLPTGLVIQWGRDVVATPGTAVSVNLSVTFPTAFLQCYATHDNASSTTGADMAVVAANPNTTSSIYINAYRVNGAAGAIGVRWLAIGY